MTTVWAAQKKRKEMMKRQNGKCWICGQQMCKIKGDKREATIDHIIPRSRGGTSDAANLKLACRSCNENRGNNLDHVFVKIGDIVAIRRKAT